MAGNHLDRVHHFFELSMEALQLDYVDNYLMHHPVGFQYVDDNDLHPVGPDGKYLIDMSTDILVVWKEMEKLVDSGRVKTIGLSNVNVSQIDRIVRNARIKPSNVQVNSL